MDLASLKVAAKLIRADSSRTQRLRIKHLAAVCQHLRRQLGVEHPLLYVRLSALGSMIVVQLRGQALRFDDDAARV